MNIQSPAVPLVTIALLTLAAFARPRVDAWFKQKFPKIERDGDLRRLRIEDVTLPVGDWRWSGVRRYLQFRYWCKCGTPLTDGPCGGAAVNAVCKTCRINYGNLSGYWGDQDFSDTLPPLDEAEEFDADAYGNGNQYE